MNKKIILLGRMGELFGREHSLNVKTIQEAMHAIDCMKGGLRRYLMECTDLGIEFAVQKGGDIHEDIKNAKDEHLLGYEELGLEIGDEDIIITPVPEGSGKVGDWLKTIVGIILIIVGYVKGMPWLISVGEMLLMAGMIGLMMPEFGSDDEENESTLFNGPIQNTKMGVPVPLCYGRLEVGGAPVNFGFTKNRVTNAVGYTFVSSSNNPSGSYNTGNGGSGGSGNLYNTTDLFGINYVDWELFDQTDDTVVIGGHKQ